MELNRKDFLKLALASGIFGLNPFQNLEAAAPNLNNYVLLHLLMEGGPDFRHIFAPNPNTAYGQAYWKNRAGSHGVSSSSSAQWQNKYNTEFEEVAGTNGNPNFGILKKCGWLLQKYKEGKVAIVANVKHSESRDHQRSLLVLQKGSYSTAAFSTGGSGWGGRIVGGSSLDLNPNHKIVSVTGQVRTFCDGNSANIISFRNSRKFGLYTPTSLINSWDNAPSKDSRVVMYRAQRSYYEKKTGLSGTPLEIFKTHYEKLRDLTTNVKSLLDQNQLSQGIQNLLRGNNALRNNDFAQQIQSAHDAFVCKDLLGMRVLSMNYGGFDTHKRQYPELENMMEEIFGTNKGFDELFKARTNDFNNTIIVCWGEFGRQLKANGDNSTDHGDANYVVFIGGPVQGGTYGEMYPNTEIPDYESFWKGIKSRNNFRAVFQSVLTKMGVTPTDVFNMNLVAGVDYETGFGNFTQIVP